MLREWYRHTYINNDFKELRYPTNINIVTPYQTTIDTWWASPQDERIFAYQSNYLSQYHPTTILVLG